MTEGRPLESEAQKTAECKRCIARSNGIWKACLTPNGHECAACKEVIEAGAWNKKMIRNHHYLNRDLVCPRCVARGYAPGKYDEHQCEECLEKFGSLKFDRKSKYKKKKNAKSVQTFLGHLGAILGPSWGQFWAQRGPLGGVLGPFWGVLGASWRKFNGFKLTS